MLQKICDCLSTRLPTLPRVFSVLSLAKTYRTDSLPYAVAYARAERFNSGNATSHSSQISSLTWVSQDPCSFCNHEGNIASSSSVINMIKFNINILTSKGMKSMQIHEIDKPAPDNSVPTSLRLYALLHIKYHASF